MSRSQTKIVPLGECFPFATKLGVEMLADDIIPEDNIKVVHGLVHPAWHPRAYWHAWVEANGRVYDWQMKNTIGSISQDDFYAEYRPEQVVKYHPAKAVGQAIKSRHHGPWHV